MSRISAIVLAVAIALSGCSSQNPSDWQEYHACLDSIRIEDLAANGFPQSEEDEIRHANASVEACADVRPGISDDS